MEDKNTRQVYLMAANLIYESRYKLKIDEDEQVFLLNLLELTVNKRDEPEFMELLKHWVQNFDDSEVDKIIKATLLAIDWSDKQSLEFNSAIILGLIEEKTRHSIGGADQQEV